MSLTELLRALEELLRVEQAAVAAYDVAALHRIVEAKNAAAAKLRQLTGGKQEPGALALAQRVAALAEANAALLAASTNAIADALGVRVTPGTYDSRARMRRQLHSAGARVV